MWIADKIRRLRIGNKKGGEEKARALAVSQPKPEMLHAATQLYGWTQKEGGRWATVPAGAEFTVRTGRGGKFVCRCVKAFDQGMIAEVFFLDSQHHEEKGGAQPGALSLPGYSTQFTVGWDSVVEQNGMDTNELMTVHSRAAQGPSLPLGQRIRACCNPLCALQLHGMTVDVTTDIIRIPKERFDDSEKDAGWSRMSSPHFATHSVDVHLCRAITGDGAELRVCESCVGDGDFLRALREEWHVRVSLPDQVRRKLGG